MASNPANIPKPGTWRYATMRGVCEPLNDVCEEFNITIDELFGERGSRSIGKAKQKAAYLLRQRGLSWPEVGKILGRSHTTVIKAAGRYEKSLM